MTSKTEIFAHRGANKVAPENTLPAFDAALSMGVDGIELDVHCSRDGQLMVIHDFTLDRTTNATGSIGERSAAELALLDNGSYFDPTFAETGVPTLQQVVDLVNGRVRLNVEIKTYDPMGGDQAEPLAALIREKRLYDQVIVSSFNPVALIKMRWIDPDIPLGLLHAQPLPDYLQQAWFSPIIAPRALHPGHTLIDESYMQWAGELGFAVNTWTVNEPDDARRLAKLGTDVIITDMPDVIRDSIYSPSHAGAG